MGLFGKRNFWSKKNTIKASSSSDPVSATSPSSIVSPTPITMTLPEIQMPPVPDPELDPVGYLRSLQAVRERCSIVTEKALNNGLNHFDVDMTKFPDAVSFVTGIIKRDYDPPFDSIPPHGRLQHFNVGDKDRIDSLIKSFSSDVDPTETCRRLVDLFLVSVLLDAGAGNQWSYKSIEDDQVYRRSEGLAVASLEMFQAGLFSSNPSNKFQVDKDALRKLSPSDLAAGLQSKPGNEVAGLDGRTQLLIRLADALGNTLYFGSSGRPGNMVDYLLSHPSTQAASLMIVPLPVLWDVIMTGLAPVWPASRTTLNGIPLGDAWPCSTMPRGSESTLTWESILPFHKLSQWLCYSLMQPMQSVLRIHFAGVNMMTGLPEYRNGGLFVDLGVLTLKPADNERGLKNYANYCKRTGSEGIEVAPMFEPSDDVIVEWRGVTVGFLDKLLVEVNKLLKKNLSLPQMLEAGSWKGGREMAAVSRPNTKEPPILLDSDGTVF